MTDIIAEYENQLAEIVSRIKSLLKQRRLLSGNITYGQLTRRIEALESEKEELEIVIGEMKKHL